MIYDKIVAIIAEHIDADPQTITKESTFPELGMDSLDAVELVMKMEEELGVTMELDRPVNNVGELVAFVEEKVNQ